MLNVVIEVRGGVADVTVCPDDVEVTIYDHDQEEVGEPVSLPSHASNEVLIEVEGGFASVTYAPGDVAVEIIDHDAGDDDPDPVPAALRGECLARLARYEAAGGRAAGLVFPHYMQDATGRWTVVGDLERSHP